jgi:hypothetical protein
MMPCPEQSSGHEPTFIGNHLDEVPPSLRQAASLDEIHSSIIRFHINSSHDTRPPRHSPREGSAPSATRHASARNMAKGDHSTSLMDSAKANVLSDDDDVGTLALAPAEVVTNFATSPPEKHFL